MGRHPFPDTIELKIWPEFFQAIVESRKGFDVRVGSDREYMVGDTLRFREWDPGRNEYTGRIAIEIVNYVMHGGPFLPADTWVLGFAGVHVIPGANE